MRCGRSKEVNTPELISQRVRVRVTNKIVPHPPYSQDLAPCDFCFSLSSEAVVMRYLRR